MSRPAALAFPPWPAAFAPDRSPALLALSDAAAILCLATAGLISHHHGVTPAGYFYRNSDTKPAVLIPDER